MAGPTESTARVHKKGFSFLDAPLVTMAQADELMIAMGFGDIVAAARARRVAGQDSRLVREANATANPSRDVGPSSAAVALDES